MFIVFLCHNANCECSQYYTCLLFLPLRVAIAVMMMVMMIMLMMIITMSFSLALGSIDLNAQGAEGFFFSKEKLNRNIEKSLGKT